MQKKRILLKRLLREVLSENTNNSLLKEAELPLKVNDILMDHVKAMLEKGKFNNEFKEFKKFKFREFVSKDKRFVLYSFLDKNNYNYYKHYDRENFDCYIVGKNPVQFISLGKEGFLEIKRVINNEFQTLKTDMKFSYEDIYKIPLKNGMILFTTKEPNLRITICLLFK